MKRPEDLTKLRTTIIECFGNLTKAAEALEIQRATLYKWIEIEPSLREAVEEGREARLDAAEEQLAKNWDDGKEASLIFFLKTQGRKRGYSQDNEGNNTTINVFGAKGLPDDD